MLGVGLGLGIGSLWLGCIWVVCFLTFFSSHTNYYELLVISSWSNIFLSNHLIM